MKLILPNGIKMNLDTSLPLEEKKTIVNEILQEWNPYFAKTFNLRKTMICIEILSSYYMSGIKDNDELSDENGEEKTKQG